MTSPEPLSSQSTPGAVSNSPIEIWKEIIDMVLCGSVYFIHDPFYKGCNPHTALRQWSDGKPIRKLEAQRGTLRLVSHSWKILADACPQQYFEPFRSREAAYQLSQTSRASRLQVDIFCSSCGCTWQCQCDICDMCFKHMTAGNPREPMLFPQLAGSSLNVEILVVPDWELKEAIAFMSLPNLRALTIHGDFSQIVGFATIFLNLVFLSLQVGPLSHGCVKLPFLRTIQIQIRGIGGCTVMETWDMPNILHIDIHVAHYCIQSMPSVVQLIRKHGRNLTSLRLKLASSHISLPDDFWHLVPRLEYLGTSTLRQGGLARPGNEHPINTLAILQREVSPITRFRVISWIRESGKMIKTIADSHA